MTTKADLARQLAAARRELGERRASGDALRGIVEEVYLRALKVNSPGARSDADWFGHELRRWDAIERSEP